MSRLYGERHRALQDRFATRKLADRVEDAVVKTAIGKGDKAFYRVAGHVFPLKHRPSGPAHGLV